MKGLKLRTVVGLFALVLCLASVLVAHVWKQNTYVRLSKDAMKIDARNSQLRNDIALLEVEVGELKKAARIESLAKGRFGLEYGKTPILVYQESDGNTGVAGRSKALSAASSETQGLEAGKVAWRIKGL